MGTLEDDKRENAAFRFKNKGKAASTENSYPRVNNLRKKCSATNQ